MLVWMKFFINKPFISVQIRWMSVYFACRTLSVQLHLLRRVNSQFGLLKTDVVFAWRRTAFNAQLDIQLCLSYFSRPKLFHKSQYEMLIYLYVPATGGLICQHYIFIHLSVPFLISPQTNALPEVQILPENAFEDCISEEFTNVKKNVFEGQQL